MELLVESNLGAITNNDDNDDRMIGVLPRSPNPVCIPVYSCFELALRLSLMVFGTRDDNQARSRNTLSLADTRNDLGYDAGSHLD
jgi:hypothetical protein